MCNYSEMQDSVPCPICRGEFGTMHLLMMEVTNSRDGQVNRYKRPLEVKQMGLDCNHCNMSPIVGKAYKCNSCSQFYLCAICFNNCVHGHHDFFFREVIGPPVARFCLNYILAFKWSVVNGA